ncbi:MAG: hypothetical protein NVSMB46_02580 [Candidatus Saccharimonadales bacterium]
MKTSIQKILFIINPFRPYKTSLEFQTRYSLGKKDRLLLILFLYSLSLLCAYFLFRDYAELLTTAKLITTNTVIVVKALAEPILLFTVCIYSLTIAISISPSVIPIFGIMAVYLLSHTINVVSILSSILILLAFLIFYIQLINSFEDLKHPSVSKSFNASLGVFVAIISIAVTFNFYNVFTQSINRLSSRLGDTISNRFNAILSIYDDSSYQTSRNITLKTYTINYLNEHKIPVNDYNIKVREQKTLAALGLSRASETDTFGSLIHKSVTAQVVSVAKTYHKLIIIIIPFAFFFVTDILSNIATNIAYGLLLITELILKKRYQ